MAVSEKIDLYKLHKADYVAPKKPVLVKIGKAAYLAVPGEGPPGGDVFQERIGALYGMAFTIKMTRKVEGKGDYAVCKLEALWSNIDGPRDEWRWKLLIRTPDTVGKTDLRSAAAKLEEKGKGAHVDKVALEQITEGQCVQMLHVGPYEREPETVAVMQSFAAEQGLAFRGAHHEIYLSDPRRVPPERLKTLLRRPVRRA